MFLRNLNLLPPYLSLISMSLGNILSAILLIPLSMLRRNYQFLNTQYAEYATMAAAQIALLIFLIFAWWKFGLEPKSYKPSGAQKAKRGHLIIAISNIAILLGCGIGIFFACAANTGTALLPFMLLLTPLCLAAWIVGVILIWSAYAPSN